MNFHKNCVKTMPKICNLRLQHKLSIHSIISELPIIPNEQDKIDLDHCFMKKNNDKKAQLCATCHEKIKDKIYFNCQDCKINVHDKCTAQTEKNCTPKIVNDDDTSNTDETEALDSVPVTAVAALPEEDSNAEMKMFKNHRLYDRRKPNLIGVQRISQRIRKTAGFFWQGHMTYSTSDNEQIVTHYWQLDSQKILVHDSNQLRAKLYEIPLTLIQRVFLIDVNQPMQFKDFKKPKNKCLFCLKTLTIIYFCGVDTQNPTCSENQLARNFYNIFKMVYLPYSKGERILNVLKLKVIFQFFVARYQTLFENKCAKIRGKGKRKELTRKKK